MAAGHSPLFVRSLGRALDVWPRARRGRARGGLRLQTGAGLPRRVDASAASLSSGVDGALDGSHRVSGVADVNVNVDRLRLLSQARRHARVRMREQRAVDERCRLGVAQTPVDEHGVIRAPT